MELWYGKDSLYKLVFQHYPNICSYRNEYIQLVHLCLGNNQYCKQYSLLILGMGQSRKILENVHE